MNKRLLLSCTLLIASAIALAQDNGSARHVYAHAENDYQIGRFDQAIDSLQANIDEFQGNLKQSAYRLIALCYLAQDDLDATRKYATLLLKENPSYSSLQDPIRFEEMIALMKAGATLTVTTASSHAESINEAPVPVTLITRQMIDLLGYGKSLNQILAAYVPGMSEVSTYAMDNVAMHGVYTSGQEKILIMENGHRLNARSTNNGRMGYAISTEKIDHIEVLRGPASSLYGNVALTAVVNVITRSGDQVNGLNVKYGYGSYNTHRADAVAGAKLLGAEMLAWGSIYSSDGKKVFVPQGTGFSNTIHDGYAHIGQHQSQPTYDWGANLSLKDFTLMMSRKYSKQVPPYSWYGQVYDYDSYRKLSGQKPGYSIGETHMELSYNKTIGNFCLSASAYGDWYELSDYAVVTDRRVTYEINPDGTQKVDEKGNPIEKLYNGLSQDTYWEERTLGAVVKADANYSLAGMEGNVLVGGQFERFSLTDTYMLAGENYDAIQLMLSESNNMIHTGNENSISFFIQDKHYFTPQLILNAGLRYDRKHRRNSTEVEAFSPRVAFIYVPRPAFSAKLSYARSFVDAPYFYRQNTAPAYKGSEDLMPEFMNAIQLDFIGNLQQYHLVYDVNFYYNHLTDIINNTQNSTATSAKYRNSGKLQMIGVEGELSYLPGRWLGRLNTSYQHVISAEDYYYSDHHIFTVPSFMLNITLGRQLLKKEDHQLWVSANIRHTSRVLQRAATTIPPKSDDDYSSFYQDPYSLLDLRLVYSFRNNLQLSGECENLFNTSYEVGGTSYFPYQRLGRTAMVSVSYKF